MKRKSKGIWFTPLIISLFLAITLPLAIYLAQNQTFLQPRASLDTNLQSLFLVTKGDLNLYTADTNEKAQAVSTHGFSDSQLALGKLFTSQQPETIPLYRFNTGSGYFYTGSEEEARSVAQYNWAKEGVAGYVFPVSKPGSIPLLRYRKDGLWGLATDQLGSQTFTDKGFTKDGVIGYFYPLSYVPPTLIPSPSPTVSPNRNTSQLGAFFFYWFDCPGTTYQCDKTKMPYQPSNYSSYSAQKLDWFKNEFSEMRKAGIDIIIAVSWGSRHPSLTTLHDSKSVPLMVQALRENNSSQKIALLDDTNSVVAEWNVSHGRVYSNPTENPSIPKMPLSNSRNWFFFYDRKIKSFYQQVPRQYWATHNGASLESGGRPIIFVYDAARSFSSLENSDEMWRSIKSSFKRDFQVEPFIVLDYSWFDFNTQRSELEKVADGKFIWAGGNDTVSKRYTLNGFTTTSVDPGFECPSWDIYVDCRSKDRHLDPLSGKRGDGERLKGSFKNAVGSDLILVETWNELNEGSGISPSNQYKNARGMPLRPDFYQDLLLQLKQTHLNSAR